MNDVTKVRIVYECSIIGIVLLTFLKGICNRLLLNILQVISQKYGLNL